MTTSKYLYVIKVKVKHIKEVIKAYNAIDGKGDITFEPTGLFSGYVNVVCENLDLPLRLSGMGVLAIINDIREINTTSYEYKVESWPVISPDGKIPNASWTGRPQKAENDIALKIKEAVDNLNKLTIEAQKEGLAVELRTNSSAMATNAPPLQATVIKVVLIS